MLAAVLLAQDGIRSAQSGPWSAAATWENGEVPAGPHVMEMQEPRAGK